MKITVPFIYEALVIMPRHRKPSLLILRDSVEVNIREVSPEELPVAFVVGNEETHWDGEKHWGKKLQSNYPNNDTPIVAARVKEVTEASLDDYYTDHSSSNPFRDYWFSAKDYVSNRHNTRFCGMRTNLNDSRVITLEQAEHREWIDDNRTAVAEQAIEIAEGLLICNGLIYKPVGEPRYRINTFGLGNNHGGTAMFIESIDNPDTDQEYYFNALDFEKASAHANTVAEKRGDTKSIPVTPNCGNVIEVLIKEAVLLPSR